MSCNSSISYLGTNYIFCKKSYIIERSTFFTQKHVVKRWNIQQWSNYCKSSLLTWHINKKQPWTNTNPLSREILSVIHTDTLTDKHSNTHTHTHTQTNKHDAIYQREVLWVEIFTVPVRDLGVLHLPTGSLLPGVTPLGLPLYPYHPSSSKGGISNSVWASEFEILISCTLPSLSPAP